MCNSAAGLDPQGSGDLGLKRHKEIPLKEQPVSQTRVAFPRGVTSSAEGHTLRVNTFLRGHQLTASTKNNRKR